MRRLGLFGMVALLSVGAGCSGLFGPGAKPPRDAIRVDTRPGEAFAIRLESVQRHNQP